MNTNTNKTDLIVSGLKGLAGIAPIVGPLLAETIGTLIPNQRIDRVAKFTEALEERIRGMNGEFLKARFSSPGFVDLLEDSLFQAARSLTDERTKYLAALVSRGLTTDEARLVETRNSSGCSGS